MKNKLTAQIATCILLVFLGGCFGGIGASSPAPPTPQSEIRETLDRMIDAYESKNIHVFMSCVSEGYTGETSELNSAIRRDFSRATNISIRYTFNNVTSDGKNNAFVAVTFNRSYTDIKTGKQVTGQGETTMNFRKTGDVYLLHTQHQPPLFGFM